jgi:hypothetical protein
MATRLEIDTTVNAQAEELFDLPAGDATKLHASADLTPKGAMRLLTPVFGTMMRRTFSRRPAQLEAGVAARR